MPQEEGEENGDPISDFRFGADPQVFGVGTCPKKRGIMKLTYVKSLKEYRAQSQFERKKLLEAARRLKKRRKSARHLA
ncbi:MAG: hypothetical protein HY077_03490 [Elusimicrobia bacterium]|nr:hypothetical protein [Elusimicrobiota bacterium]